ncbi:MAG: potassium channel protein [Planctomycetota bacterium]
MSFRNRLIIAFVLLSAITAIGTAGYKIIGGPETSIIDAVYMTVITLTTVGYGEIVDLSNKPVGRIFTMILLISGIGILSFVATSLTAFIIELQLKGITRRKKMLKEISGLTDHYIVCGLGATGIHIIQELHKSLRRFVAIDHDEERLQKLSSGMNNLLYLAGDATDDEILKQAGIERARGIIISLPSDKDNLYVTVIAKQLNPKIKVVALGVEDKAMITLKKAGADSVVSPSLIGGLRMASEMVRPSAVRFLDEMLRQTTSTTRIEEIVVPAGSSLINKTISELELKNKFNLLILAARSAPREEMIYNPPLDFTIKEGTILVVMGEITNIHQAKEFAQ